MYQDLWTEAEILQPVRTTTNLRVHNRHPHLWASRPPVDYLSSKQVSKRNTKQSVKTTDSTEFWRKLIKDDKSELRLSWSKDSEKQNLYYLDL